MKRRKVTRYRDGNERGSSDRDSRGRFAPGNAAARGHSSPMARKKARLSRLLLDTPIEDLHAAVMALMQRAKRGEVEACKLLFAYCFGKPVSADNRPAAEIAAEEAMRRRFGYLVKAANRIERREDNPHKPDRDIREKASVLAELGLADDKSMALRLGINPQRWQRWRERGARAVSEDRRTTAEAKLVLCLGEAEQRYRHALIINQRLSFLERLEPLTYGKKQATDAEAEQEQWETDPNEAYL